MTDRYTGETGSGANRKRTTVNYAVYDYLRQKARYQRLLGVCRVVGYFVAGVGCGLAIAAMLLLPEVTP